MRKGRFTQPASDVARKFSQSVSFDHRLYKHDIAGSIGHAEGLSAAGIITSAEFEKIRQGLNDIEKEIESGKFTWDPVLEDVHMNIEAALTKRIGSVGAKLHTARSRNDQIALDLRLYIKAEITETLTSIALLQRTLLKLAATHVDVVMPGYTHLQRAQPLLFAHYLLAQIEALERDAARLRDCLVRTNVLPLGSGALAGSTIVLDRDLIAQRLGFPAVSQNSLDAVGDRDVVCEFLFCLAMIGMHLSRFSEDLILWSTSEFGYIDFSDAFSTGSSLMPQKKNPDMVELSRGKTGRLYGNLVAVMTMLKGLPTSYNRDLQEDKEALFDSVDTVSAVLELFAAMLPEIRVNSDRMEKAANDPALLATDIADHLVTKGVAFRDAYDAVGKLVARAAEMGVSLNNVPGAEMKKLSPMFDDEIGGLFDVRASLAKRRATGAPSPENISERIKFWEKQLSGRTS